MKAERRQEAKNRPAGSRLPGEDPDIAGIIPGPQRRPDDDLLGELPGDEENPETTEI